MNAVAPAVNRSRLIEQFVSVERDAFGPHIHIEPDEFGQDLVRVNTVASGQFPDLVHGPLVDHGEHWAVVGGRG